MGEWEWKQKNTFIFNQTAKADLAFSLPLQASPPRSQDRSHCQLSARKKNHLEQTKINSLLAGWMTGFLS